ncbi:MAG: flagellar protein FlbB [Treponema sp.]|jgi:flagellar protein FlbB|nr:flagellar protein FlbB [Treponema sp.]
MVIKGKIVVLILLILVIIAGGMVWFDYLNVIDIKTVFAPVYGLFHRPGRSAAKPPTDEELLNLDAERFAIRMEALELQKLELEKTSADLQNRRGEIEQMAQELEVRQQALEEREGSLEAAARDAASKDRNVARITAQLNGMPPAQAAGIIAQMNDQDAIDVFRKADELAAAQETSSLVSVWLMQLPAERAAVLLRKMASSPSSAE